MKEKLQQLGAEIGMMQIKRRTGTYIPMSELQAKVREFKKLSKLYKKSL